MYRYTIGADPEVFVADIAENKIVPICGKIGGTKKAPKPFSSAEGFFYQEDNVAFEMNCPPLAPVRNFFQYARKMKELAERELAGKGLKPIWNVSSYRFRKKDLSSEQAQTIGCDPDMCAYGGEDNGVPRDPFKIEDLGNMRYTGGHLHFGYDREGLNIPDHVFVKLLEAYVYLPFLKFDAQTSRRQKYGLAGLYRPKPYGVEYRTPSNFWMSNSDAGIGLAARAHSFLHSLHNPVHQHLWPEIYMELPEEEVKSEIDQGGTDDLQALIRKTTIIVNNKGIAL